MAGKKYSSIVISGLLFLLILSACGSRVEAQAVTPIVAESQQNITYPGANGVTLAGTLLIPAHRQGTRVPGVIIVAGSGPTDRNGNQAGGITTDLYSQLADQLAQQGIASLRYDKRGVGASTTYPHPKDPSHPTQAEIKAIQDFFAWNNYVEDARATLSELQQQPAINPSHTGMIGHSEGSMIIGQAATMGPRLAHPPVALVLISAPGRPIDVVVREQLANSLAQRPSIPAAFVLSKYDEIIAGLKKNGQAPASAFEALKANPQVPVQLTLSLESTFQIAYDELWYGELQDNPSATIKHYPGPVLVLQGASDTQVSAREDTPLLDAALKSRRPDDHRVVIIPHTSHNMKAVKNPQTDPGDSGPVVPECTHVLRQWLARTLAVTR